jgi:hypothetical protein
MMLTSRHRLMQLRFVLVDVMHLCVCMLTFDTASIDLLAGVVDLIFDKALLEPHFSEM